MSIKRRNGFDGSTPTSEMPKISFSCGSHKKRQTCFRDKFVSFLSTNKLKIE